MFDWEILSSFLDGSRHEVRGSVVVTPITKLPTPASLPIGGICYIILKICPPAFPRRMPVGAIKEGERRLSERPSAVLNHFKRFVIRSEQHTLSEAAAKIPSAALTDRIRIDTLTHEQI